jgi:hypothetical protein
MKTLIQDGLIRITERWWAVILIIALNFAAFGILFALEDRFEALTNQPVFDTQNDLTASRLLDQLPLYQGEARAAYLQFVAFDFLFPAIAGVFVAVLWTLMLRVNTWAFPRHLLRLGLPLFVFMGTFWDWLENITFLLILGSEGTPSVNLVEAALLFKRLKLAWLFLNGPITLLVIGLLLGNLVQRGWARWTKRLA